MISSVTEWIQQDGTDVIVWNSAWHLLGTQLSKYIKKNELIHGIKEEGGKKMPSRFLSLTAARIT